MTLTLIIIWTISNVSTETISYNDCIRVKRLYDFKQVQEGVYIGVECVPIDHLR